MSGIVLEGEIEAIAQGDLRLGGESINSHPEEAGPEAGGPDKGGHGDEIAAVESDEKGPNETIAVGQIGHDNGHDQHSGLTGGEDDPDFREPEVLDVAQINREVGRDCPKNGINREVVALEPPDGSGFGRWDEGERLKAE